MRLPVNSKSTDEPENKMIVIASPYCKSTWQSHCIPLYKATALNWTALSLSTDQHGICTTLYATVRGTDQHFSPLYRASKWRVDPCCIIC